MEPIDPQKLIACTTSTGISTTLSSTTTGHVNLNDIRSPTETVLSGDVPVSSMGTSREEEEDSSNQNSSDCKSSGQR